MPRGDPTLQDALQERIYHPFDETRRAANLRPTALIVTKLRAYADSGSTRHLDDVASILRVQGNAVDVGAVDTAAARLKVMGVWRSLQEKNELD